MLKFSLVVATFLTLGAGTAMAKPALVRQRMQIGSSQIDTRDFHEMRNPGAHATQPSDWDQEPETISRGTEP
jgi:hypothetical protein